MPHAQQPTPLQPEQAFTPQSKALLLSVTLALGWILVPFYGAILWGMVIALLAYPVFGWLLHRLKHRRNVAALLTMLLVLLAGVMPLFFLVASLLREASNLVSHLRQGSLSPLLYLQGVYETLPTWVMDTLKRFGLTSFDSVQQRLADTLSDGGPFIANGAFNLGQNTFGLGTSLFIALYLAFFLVRDGAELTHALGRQIPLPPLHKRELLNKFTTVLLATIKGNFLVAAIQGALGGLAFWFLNVNGALLWAVLMAMLSMLPAVGAALVWAPVAMYFLATGAIWQGATLIAYGVLVIGLVDNLLRPIWVGHSTRLPDYMVMVSTLGGMAVFGLNGFVLGPVIAAMFLAVWHLYGPAATDMRTPGCKQASSTRQVPAVHRVKAARHVRGPV